MGRTKTPSDMDIKSQDEQRLEYQRRLDAGESIAQFVREIGIVESTMRWRLSKLGVVIPQKTKKLTVDAHNDYSRKYLVSQYTGDSRQVEQRLIGIANQFGIGLNGVAGVQNMLKKLLLSLVVDHSNLQIAKIFDVDEKTIRKWMAKFEIETLGRGEWAIRRAKEKH